MVLSHSVLQLMATGRKRCNTREMVGTDGRTDVEECALVTWLSYLCWRTSKGLLDRLFDLGAACLPIRAAETQKAGDESHQLQAGTVGASVRGPQADRGEAQDSTARWGDSGSEKDE